MLKNIIESYKHIPYTIRHYKAMRRIQYVVLGCIPYPWHDLDKVLMYIFLPFLGTKRIKSIHKKYSKHHITMDKNPDECEYIEAILDWECARFTKPDKPENAMSIIESKYKDTEHYIYLRLYHQALMSVKQSHI